MLDMPHMKITSIYKLPVEVFIVHEVNVAIHVTTEVAVDGVVPRLVDHKPVLLQRLWNTVKPELVVTSIKQPTCLKQPYRMFPNFNFVLI